MVVYRVGGPKTPMVMRARGLAAGVASQAKPKTVASWPQLGGRLLENHLAAQSAARSVKPASAAGLKLQIGPALHLHGKLQHGPVESDFGVL